MRAADAHRKGGGKKKGNRHVSLAYASNPTRFCPPFDIIISPSHGSPICPPPSVSLRSLSISRPFPSGEKKSVWSKKLIHKFYRDDSIKFERIVFIVKSQNYEMDG